MLLPLATHLGTPEQARALASRHGAVPVSALEGRGLEALLERAESALDERFDAGSGPRARFAMGGGLE